MTGTGHIGQPPPLFESNRFENRHVLVTGVCGAIGQTVADDFAAAGATVTGLDIREPESDPTWTQCGQFVEADVSDPEAVEWSIETVTASNGDLDVVVNNAGINHLGSVETVTVEEWDRTLAVNLRGTFLVSRSALPSLRAQNGTIVNIASTAGLSGAPEYAAYGPSKGGIVNLTRQMAHDYSTEGIRVNAVAPGVIEAGMANQELADAETAARKRTMTLLDRLGHPRDVANAVLFLASDAASFMTGSILTADGGGSA